MLRYPLLTEMDVLSMLKMLNSSSSTLMVGVPGWGHWTCGSLNDWLEAWPGSQMALSQARHLAQYCWVHPPRPPPPPPKLCLAPRPYTSILLRQGLVCCLRLQQVQEQVQEQPLQA